MYEKALQIEMACVGGSHTDVAVTKNNVGEVYAKPGRGSEAMLMYEEALSIVQQAMGTQKK